MPNPDSKNPRVYSGSIKRYWLVWLVVSCLLMTTPGVADEGMWLYNAFPKDKVKAKYGFRPTRQWLDHVRLGSVRFNNGGSGSFVSADGLTFTNHHIAADCIQKISTGGQDYIKSGFYARTEAEEAKCPDLELNQLVDIEDVTSRIKAAAKPEMSTAEAGQAQRAAMSAIEKDCAGSTGLRCDVITFYSGEVYHLYKYKKYTDVRLVFAPEFDTAFFGGDPDNFTYPRYDLDISFFRVYENDKPVHLDHYLHWSRSGVKEGDLVFVSGHPGLTMRFRTVAQLEYLRDVDFPSRLETYARRIALLEKFSAESTENDRIAKEDIFLYQNSQKAFKGLLEGLHDQELMASKSAEERRLRAVLGQNSGSDPWAAIAQAMQVQKDIYLPLTYLERRRAFNSDLVGIAASLVRAAEEKPKPNEKRLREYRDSALPSLEQQLLSSAPIYKSLETVTLADSLSQMQQAFGNDSPMVQKILKAKDPADVARQLIQDTKLDDLSVRKQLYEGGATAIQASSDPLITLVRTIDPDARAARKRYEDEVDSVERSQGATIARLRFSQSGFNQYPDATFTLRLSFGAVKGYSENGKHIPYFTSMGGAYERAAEHGNQPPYKQADSWIKEKSNLNLATPLNFVSTADLTGGNSGSPTVNKAGEVVGIVFDGNLQSLPWDFIFDDQVGRGVHVDSQGILEALRKIYGANALADDLTGGIAPPAAAKKKGAKAGGRP
jgi:Peptidase S46